MKVGTDSKRVKEKKSLEKQRAEVEDKATNSRQQGQQINELASTM